MSHELLAVEVRANRIKSADKPNDAVFLRVHFGRHDDHFNPGGYQEGAKDVKDPMQPGDQGHTHTNHHPAHDQRAQNAPEQHAMLVFGGDQKVSENQGDDKDVVHRK